MALPFKIENSESFVLHILTIYGSLNELLSIANKVFLIKVENNLGLQAKTQIFRRQFDSMPFRKITIAGSLASPANTRNEFLSV